MSLAVESYKEITRHIKERSRFESMLRESVMELVNKQVSEKPITLSDLMGLLPSNIENKVKKYKSIME